MATSRVRRGSGPGDLNVVMVMSTLSFGSARRRRYQEIALPEKCANAALHDFSVSDLVAASGVQGAGSAWYQIPRSSFSM